DRVDQQARHALPARFLEYEDVADECERRPVGHHARKADLRSLTIGAEAQRVAHRAFDGRAVDAARPVRFLCQELVYHREIEAPRSRGNFDVIHPSFSRILSSDSSICCISSACTVSAGMNRSRFARGALSSNPSGADSRAMSTTWFASGLPRS